MPEDQSPKQGHQMMPFFGYEHLPRDHVPLCKDFQALAQKTVDRGGDPKSVTKALESLREAREHAIQATLARG